MVIVTQMTSAGVRYATAWRDILILANQDCSLVAYVCSPASAIRGRVLCAHACVCVRVQVRFTRRCASVDCSVAIRCRAAHPSRSVSGIHGESW